MQTKQAADPTRGEESARLVAVHDGKGKGAMMSTYRLRVWTGPTLVKELAAKIREAGYNAEEGTEHVYGIVSEGWPESAASHNFCVDLERKHGTSFGLKLASADPVSA